MNIVLFGPPGAGKGTQSALLVERLKMVQISTGDLFRAAIKNQTDLGKKAKEFMDKGQLVPDAIVIDMVAEALDKSLGGSFILDGFPRTVVQAKALLEMLDRKSLKIGKAVFLEVPSEELLARLTSRRVCKECGATYNLIGMPPKAAGVCDTCGGQVIQRDDDKEEVIKTRLKTYEESTSPLRGFFKEIGLFHEVNGSQSTETVYKQIDQAIK